MPTASVKTDSNGVSDSSDSLHKLLANLQDRISKLEKQKNGLERDPEHPKGTFYKNLAPDQITYKKLNSDQMNHLRQMDVAYSKLEAVKELSEVVKSHISEYRTNIKKMQKKVSQERARENFEKVKDVLRAQVALKLLAGKPELFSGEIENFPKVDADYLERLFKVNSNITPPCPTESMKSINDLVTSSAEHIHLLLDGRKKMVTRATSYEQVKQLLHGSVFNKCYYIEPKAPEEEIVEEQEEETSIEESPAEPEPTVQEEKMNESPEEAINEISPEPVPETDSIVQCEDITANITPPVDPSTMSFMHPATALYEASAVVDAPPPPGLPHPHSVPVAAPIETVPEEVPVHVQSADALKPHNVSISELITRGAFDFLQDSVIDNAPSEVYRDPAVVSIGSINSSHLSYNTSSTSPPLNNMAATYSAPPDQYYTTPPPPAAPTQATLPPPPAVDTTPNPPPPIPMPTPQDAPAPGNWRESESWCEETPAEQWSEEPTHHHNGSGNTSATTKSNSSPPMEEWSQSGKERSWGDSESMQWNEEAPSNHYRGKENRGGTMESWGEEPRRSGHHDGERRPNHQYRGGRMRRDDDEENEGGKMWNSDESYEDRNRGGMYRRGGRGGRMNGGGGGGYRGRGGYGGSYQNGGGRGGYGGGFRGGRGMNNGSMPRGNMRGGGMSNGGNRGSGSMNRGSNPNYRSRNNYNNQQPRSYYHQQAQQQQQ